MENNNKKKILIGTLCGVSGLALGAGVTAGAIIGVQNNKKNISVATKDVNIVANNMVANWQFTLKKELKNDEEIGINYEGDTGKFSIQPLTIQKKLITIPIYWLNPDSHVEESISIDITFTCKDKKSGKKKWSEVVKGCKVTYLPYVQYFGSKTVEGTTDYNDKKLTGQFVFDLPNGIAKRYDGKLKAIIDTQKYDDGKFKDVKCTITPNEEGTKATLTVSGERDASTIVNGDNFLFDVQIFCMNGDSDIIIWSSSSFLSLCVLYDQEEIKIPSEYCHFEPFSEGSEFDTLTKVEIPENDTTEYNTLEIPVKNGDRYVLAIGDGENKITGIENVSKIKFPQGSYLTYFKNNALSGYSNIVFLDVSNIPDETSGLEEMDFGTGNFDGWSSSGKIVWNSEFSQYKKHLLMTKLYSAGLSSVNWYNIKLVNDVSELKEACSAGANIKLNSNITIPYSSDYTGQIDIKESLVLDLNGHTITSDGPIANYEKKEFAIFGIWNGAEVVVTDTSDNHNGSIKAYNQNIDYKTKQEVDFAHMIMPKLTPEQKEEDPYQFENQWFVYRADLGNYTSREQRCFYIRTDTPTKSRTSLDILAGKYYGDCTTVMNWNGVCWIEDAYSTTEAHEYAPEFHVLTPQSNYNGTTIDRGCKELINCDDTLGKATGDARMEIWNAKFYGYKHESNDEYDYYDPTYADCDKDSSGNPPDWTAAAYYNALLKQDKYETKKEYNNQDHYLLVTTHLKQ